MLKFALAYSPLFIGFMMMLMILFSEHPTFNLNFLGVFGKVILQNRNKNKKSSIGGGDKMQSWNGPVLTSGVIFQPIWGRKL